ncbi:MAG: hypothetical protein A4E53_03868 [Pelotomaculum sp. PtaB.Bin104]|nr:MAG: hypothetical protein A4E53_03868 [Pelotomaculum sp. PtaB.Bin104]
MSPINKFYNKIISIADSPERLIRGVALGVAFDFLPIPVISIPLSYLVAHLTQCNPIAAASTVIFFKLAVPFFYTLDVLTGTSLLGTRPGLEVQDTGIAFLDRFLDEILQYGYPFLMGSLINATLAGLAVYLILRFLVARRRRRREKLKIDK